MIIKKRLKSGLVKFVFGVFLVMMGLIGGVTGAVVSDEPVYAEPIPQANTEDVTQPTPATNEDDQASNQTSQNAAHGDSCQSSLGAIGWLVCPTTGKIAEAVDWLYDKIENILVINPVPAEDGSPIFEIWKYCRGITNIVFIIFLLVVIYSQITGLGISNYGIKKTLPKLIVAAVMVNLSFLICSLAVDLSNVIGNSLRGVFTSIAESAVVGGASGLTASGDLTREMKMSYAGMYSSLAGGAALAVGAGAIAIESGAIWMLIPTVLGAIVAVATGLITIALRQAVVALLIMVSPLAMVANILPNTEQWFKKWKDLLYKMLIFYPMFSLLFGASQLAGFAIIASAKDGFGLMLGMAVQISPLFFSWKLMQMSGTFLGNINARLRGLTAAPLAANRSWAESRRQLSKQRHLASGQAYTPSLRLMQFMSNRRIAREAELGEVSTEVKNRGLAYHASSHYRKDGTVARKGERAYAGQARNMEYQRAIARHSNNMNKGLGELARGSSQKARLDALDTKNVNASDYLKVEQARGEKIEYDNAASFYKRMEDAMNVHMDAINGFEYQKNKDGKLVLDENGNKILVPKATYKFHFDPNNLAKTAEMARYNAMKQIMDGSEADVQFAAATAAQAFDTQKKIVETKMQKYFELAPPTQDVVYRLTELTKNASAIKEIDSILPGLRILNQRGDTDLLRQQMKNILDQGLDLGTHASQALASFLMFEVKDSDPWLRRFGKYINLETANVFNENKRQEMKVTYDEYIKGYHKEPNGKLMYAKRPMSVLMEGTSLDGVERTAYSNFDDSLKEVYSYIGEDKEKHLDVAEYLKKREEIQNAIGPQFISASLKYLSGSEQLKNAVSFLTGYSYSQVKNDDGSNVLDKNGDVVYEWKARWEKEGDTLYGSDVAEEYFRRKTIEYLKNQTPSQILGLRSDYYSSLANHLVEEYENTDMKDWTPEAIAERESLMRERAEIQTRYGDLPADKAQEMRKADMAELRKKMAGAQFRQVLDSKGKLNQIYRTRRSGAANNAKDWVRDWLNLDDEASINFKLNVDRDRMNKHLDELKKKVMVENEADLDGQVQGNGIYTEHDTVRFTTGIEDIWDDLKTDDDSAFYEQSLSYLEENLGKDSYIVAEYKRYRKDDPYADGYTLKEFLLSLLSDIDNY